MEIMVVGGVAMTNAMVLTRIMKTAMLTGLVRITVAMVK